jgi:hypothetical protein
MVGDGPYFDAGWDPDPDPDYVYSRDQSGGSVAAVKLVDGVTGRNCLVTKTATRTVTQIGDGQNLDKLNRVLREEGWLIRRLKKDVLTELPAKTRVIVEVEPDDACLAALDLEREASEQWEEALEDAEVEMELAKASGDKATFEEAVKALATCKRIPFDEIARVRHDTAVAKLQQCMAMLDERIEAKGPKIIVFGHHKDVLHPLHERYPNSVILTGETPSDERDRIVHRFQTDPTCGPFIGSIRACGFAITLTAASHAVFVEEDWTPGKISQAEDRAHRIGQKDNVLVEHFILPGSIDAKMAKTHVRKQAIADAALDEVQAMLVKSEVSLGVESAGTTITFAQMDVGANLARGEFWDTVGALDVASDLASGSLVATIAYKTAEPADVNGLDVAADLASGSLTVVIAYKTAEPADINALDVASDLAAGSLVVVITYVDHTIPPEGLDVSSDLVSGSLA